MKVKTHRLQIALFSLLLSIPLSALAKSQNQWKADLKYQSVEDSLSKSNIVGLNLALSGSYLFSQSIFAKYAIGSKLETGSSQSLFTEEFNPKSSIYLIEASMNSKLFDLITLSAGALQLGSTEPSLLLANQSFPALREKLFYPFSKNFQIELTALQAIPTSQSLSTKTVGKENTPSVFIETIKLKAKFSRYFQLYPKFSYFAFKELTRGIAQDSRFYGNSVTGVGPQGAKFLYLYEGYETGAKLRSDLTSFWSAKFGTVYIKNTKAPESLNNGFIHYTEQSFKIGTVEVSPLIGIFEILPDSSPAFYTDKSLGHNNRKGNFAELKVKLPKYNLNISTKYVNSEVKIVSPLQADRKYFQVNIGTDYADL